MTKNQLESEIRMLNETINVWETRYEELRVKYNRLVEMYEEMKEISDQIINEHASTSALYNELQEQHTALMYEANELRAKNNRGAGRKTKVNDESVRKVNELRAKGKSIPYIASVTQLSVGLVHKIIHLNDVSNINL